MDNTHFLSIELCGKSSLIFLHHFKNQGGEELCGLDLL